MLRFAIIFLTCTLCACSEESTTPSEPEETTASIVAEPKSSTLAEFTENFAAVSEIPSLDLQGDMKTSLVLDKSAFTQVDDLTFLPPNLAHDWITPLIQTTDSDMDENSWVAVFCNTSEINSTYCLVQIKEEDIKFYLLRMDHETYDNSELIHLGSINTIKYKDSSEEIGQEYDFEITDCENLILELKGDTLYTKCMRYSATVGKDWRIDQNLYVNDTVKLPILENSYSLY